MTDTTTERVEIPDDVYEVAARAEFARHHPEGHWHEISDWYRADCRRRTRVAVDAAAPLLMATARRQGLDAIYDLAHGPSEQAPTASVLAEVAAERSRQDAKWSEQNHPDGTDEVWRAAADRARRACQRAAAHDEVTWFHILREEFWEAMAETDPSSLRIELVQLAAVAVAHVEAIDRRTQETTRG